MTSLTDDVPTARRAAPLPPEQRRAVIVDAVLPLLTERGAAVTSRELAAAAGVSEGTIFNVFADKDELYAAAIERAIDQEPFERAVSEIDQTASLEIRVAAATELIQRRIVDIWRLVSQFGPHSHPSSPRPLPDSPALAALLGADATQLRVSPVEAARLLRGITLACSHPLLTAEPRSVPDIAHVFLHGVGSPS